MDQIELLDRVAKLLIGTAAEIMGIRQRLLGQELPPPRKARRKRAARKVVKRKGRPPKPKAPAAPVFRKIAGTGPEPVLPKRRGRPPKIRPEIDLGGFEDD